MLENTLVNVTRPTFEVFTSLCRFFSFPNQLIDKLGNNIHFRCLKTFSVKFNSFGKCQTPYRPFCLQIALLVKVYKIFQLNSDYLLFLFYYPVLYFLNPSAVVPAQVVLFTIWLLIYLFIVFLIQFICNLLITCTYYLFVKQIYCS